jgi:stage III sporulation protein AH
MQIEGLLGAHGFPLTVALVNPSQVEVVVGQAALSTSQVAQIADTVTQVTGVPPQDIVIVPKTAAS